jgi:hypothetical protein
LRQAIQVHLRAAPPSFGSDIQHIGELRNSENLMNRGGNIDQKESAPTGTQFPVREKNYADTPISSCLIGVSGSTRYPYGSKWRANRIFFNASRNSSP